MGAWCGVERVTRYVVARQVSAGESNSPTHRRRLLPRGCERFGGRRSRFRNGRDAAVELACRLHAGLSSDGTGAASSAMLLMPAAIFSTSA